jgi:hypothetical protein
LALLSRKEMRLLKAKRALRQMALNYWALPLRRLKTEPLTAWERVP